MARDLAAELLTGLNGAGGRADDLALAVSELVTNAVVHGPSAELEIRLHSYDSIIRLEVSDEGTAAFDWPSDDTERHRGLPLVKAFSERCGIMRDPSTLVWCEFDLA
jgi:anti-sigma regulatory factor (Ser/Thr protein kinase)